MQGTVVMLMALSSLGCHNKSYDVVYAPPTYSCFGGGCYANVYPNYVAPSSYNGCYAGGYSGCYSSCYSGCFGGGCYGGGYGSCYSSCYGGGYRSHHGCGLLARLFGCCGRNRHNAYDYDDFGAGYGYGMPYDPPVFGYALQFNYGAPVVGDGSTPGSVPSEAAPPVPANPVEPAATPAATTPKPAAPMPDVNTPPTPPRPTPAIPVPTPPKPNT